MPLVLEKLGSKAEEANGKDTEVLNRVKSAFFKRTCTLYRLMYPKITKKELNSRVSDAWDRLSEKEKNIYISMVEGKFGSRNFTVMVNPVLTQLIDPLTPLPEKHLKVSLVEDSEDETDSDADDDPDYRPSRSPVKRKCATQRCKKRRNTTLSYRKQRRSLNAETYGRPLLEAVSHDIQDEGAAIPKHLHKCELDVEFDYDPELKAELEKFDLMFGTKF